MIDKLEMFIAVAREEHFGRAAAALGIRQPTLSAGIKSLEAELGIQLIFRDARFQGLTPEGRTALVLARRIVDDASQLRQAMRPRQQDLSGNLRLGAVPTSLTWAAKLSKRFNERHPSVGFTISSRASGDILRLMEDRELDAGITYLDNEPLGGVVTEPLYEERFMLVCAEGAAFSQRAMVGWHELDGRRLCLLSRETQNRRIINRNFLEAGVTPSAMIESDSALVLVANVASGDWMTILPTEIAHFLSGGKNLRIIPLSGAGRGHVIGLVAPHHASRSPVLAELMAHARALSSLTR